VRVKGHARKCHILRVPAEDRPTIIFYNFKTHKTPQPKLRRLSHLHDYHTPSRGRGSESAKLSDLQAAITQAIAFHGEPCPFEKIYEYVNNKLKEKDIRRRDGTPYATDCRRAIQANLRANPHHATLFMKDPKHKNMWRLCPNPLTAELTSPFLLGKKESKLDMKLHDETDDTDSVDSSKEVISNSRTRAGRTALKLSLSQPRGTPEDNLSPLQEIISNAILFVGVDATVDQIEATIQPHWPHSSNTELPSIRHIVVVALLKKVTPVLFVRSVEDFSRWGLAASHPWGPSSEHQEIVGTNQSRLVEVVTTFKQTEITIELEGERDLGF